MTVPKGKNLKHYNCTSVFIYEKVMLMLKKQGNIDITIILLVTSLKFLLCSFGGRMGSHITEKIIYINYIFLH